MFQRSKKMHRGRTLAFVIIMLFPALAGQAEAQWGYGYYPYGYGGYGWGGWGATAQGDIARGLAYFNMGAGIYNRETAIARSIDTDTAIRWNQYVYLSQQEATRAYFARRNAAIARDKNAYDALVKRIQEHPTASDVESGDALNAALDQLSDPRIHSSALRMADAPISAQMIRDIPFRNAAEAATFSLSQLKAAAQWPAVLLEPRFAEERAEFETLVEEARRDSLDDGQVAPGVLSRIRRVITRLKDKLAAKPLEDSAENQEALRFIKTVTAFVRLLEKPEIDQVLAELNRIDKTTIGNLLAFMHTFNLRFAPATTARQRQVYAELYPILGQTRDRILREARLDESTASKENKGKLNDFFSAMDLEHIEGKKKAPPPPPVPEQPKP
jgi:hypothetical protein